MASSIGSTIHAIAPHSFISIYLWTYLICAAAVTYVYGFARKSGASKYLPSGWIIRATMIAAPLPIVILSGLAPFDHDLHAVIASQPLLIGLAALSGIAGIAADLRSTIIEAIRTRDRVSATATVPESSVDQGRTKTEEGGSGSEMSSDEPSPPEGVGDDSEM